jgi:hypothetical protein
MNKCKGNKKTVIAYYQADGASITNPLRWCKVMKRVLKPNKPFPLKGGNGFFIGVHLR